MVDNDEIHTGLYRVVGRNAVNGHKTGDVFELTATKAVIGALIASNHIVLHKGA